MEYEAYARKYSYNIEAFNERIDTMLTQMLQATGLAPPQLVSLLKEETRSHYERLLAEHIKCLRELYSEDQLDVLVKISEDYPWIKENAKVLHQRDFEAGTVLGQSFECIARKFMEENMPLMEEWLLEQDFSQG